MAIAIIYQRDRNAQLAETTPPVLTTNTPCRGLVYDQGFLWASAGTELVQFTSKPIAVVKTVTATDTYDDLCFDGEYFWGPVSGNAGIAQVTREGARVNFIGSITTAGPIGMTFDGQFLWGLYLKPLLATYHIFQTDRPPQGIIKEFNTGLGSLSGLVFDGEYLVTNDRASGNRQLSYFTREGQLVKTTTGGEVGGGDANGLAFDGEFFYTMLSV